MYYYVEGTVRFKDKDLAVIDCGGVGYACHTSVLSLSQVNIGEKKRFYTYLHIREDVMELFGFVSMEELSCFKQLIGISGVGPKAGIAILSVLTPDKLALAVLSGDEKPLMAASGVGKRLAQRIILELKNKLSRSELEDVSSTAVSDLTEYNSKSEAIAALEALGYSLSEASEAVNRIDGQYTDAGEIIRLALKYLAE